MENGQFQGLKCCFWGQFVTKGYDVDGAMGELVNVMRSPDYASEGVSETVSETAQIARKTIKTLFNVISLLKNPPEIQSAIREEKLQVSRGYLFAANLDYPIL